MTEDCDICKDEQLVRQVVARQFRKNCYKFEFFRFSILSKAWEFHFLGLWGSLAMLLPLSFSGSIIMINIIMMRDERSKVFKVLLFLDSRRCDQILTNSWSGWLSLISWTFLLVCLSIFNVLVKNVKPKNFFFVLTWA